MAVADCEAVSHRVKRQMGRGLRPVVHLDMAGRQAGPRASLRLRPVRQGSADDDTRRCGAAGQREQGGSQLGQGAAVDGERGDRMGRCSPAWRHSSLREPAVRRSIRADETGDDRPGPAELAAGIGRPRATSASSPPRSTSSPQPESLRGSAAPSSASSTGACGRTRSGPSATGRTTTWTSAAPARSAAHAAASSRQAATALASTRARYPEQPRRRTQGQRNARISSGRRTRPGR